MVLVFHLKGLGVRMEKYPWISWSKASQLSPDGRSVESRCKEQMSVMLAKLRRNLI